MTFAWKKQPTQAQIEELYEAERDLERAHENFAEANETMAAAANWLERAEARVRKAKEQT